MACRGLASDKKGAQEQAAKLAFHDESGFSLKPSIRRTWAPRGQTLIVKHRFNWKRLHALGTLICEPDGSAPDLLLHLQPETIKEDAVIAYLKALHRQVPGRVVLLWDRLPAHRSRRVQDYVQANADWLTVEWLPAYAPELNPMEYFWSATKGKPLANLGADRIEELERVIHRTHRKTRKQPHKLQELLVASSLYTDDMFVTSEGGTQ